MSKQEKSVIQDARNFKHLYRKKYGDVIQIHDAAKYDPETLFDLCVKYFEWAESESLKAAETASYQGELGEFVVHKPRVFTIKGLSLFLMVTESVLADYRKKEGYSSVMEFVDTVIIEQKYQLGASGMVNAGFIAKDLNIDRQQQINVIQQTSATATADAEATSNQTIDDAVERILSKL